jgi:hypothetical protein
MQIPLRSGSWAAASHADETDRARD